MKRKLPLSLPAVLAALLLPGIALVGCKSTEVTDADAAPEAVEAVAGSEIDIVRPAHVEAPAVAEVPAPKEKKKFRLFGLGKKKDAPEEAVADTDADAVEEVAEPRTGRRPLFGSKKDKARASGSEVAAVKEKKKFRLFGFGKKKDADADADVAEDDASLADEGGAGNEVEAIAKTQGPTQMPWDEPALDVASDVYEDLPGGESFADFPDTGADTASGVTARIRPGESSGGFSPLDATPAAASTALDRVPSLTAPVRPRDDGFMPLTPEPKFPAEEGILPPGN